MRQLSEENLKILREKELINTAEIAYKNGDVLVAEHVVTGERRVIDTSAIMLIKEDKQLLKG
jgi:hypothetical protein